MADGGVEQVQVVLDADLFELGTGGGVELGAIAAVAHVDIVHITHQLQGRLLADVLVEGAAEVVCNIVFAVGEGACAAKAAHDGAALAADAGFDLDAVDGTAALGQCMTGLKHGHLQGWIALNQLIGRKNAAGTGADDNHVVIHVFLLKIIKTQRHAYKLL